jgi:hypothetical protein
VAGRADLLPWRLVLRVRFLSALDPSDTTQMSKSFKALTSSQMRTVQDAANQLHQRARETFCRSVAEALKDGIEHGDGDVYRAVRAALAELHEEKQVQM